MPISWGSGPCDYKDPGPYEPWQPWGWCCVLLDIEYHRPITDDLRPRFLHRDGPLVALVLKDGSVVVVDLARCYCRDQDEPGGPAAQEVPC